MCFAIFLPIMMMIMWLGSTSVGGVVLLCGVRVVWMVVFFSTEEHKHSISFFYCSCFFQLALQSYLMSFKSFRRSFSSRHFVECKIWIVFCNSFTFIFHHQQLIRISLRLLCSETYYYCVKHNNIMIDIDLILSARPQMSKWACILV